MALCCLGSMVSVVCAQKTFRLSEKEYEDKVKAIWSGQIIAASMGFKFEHAVSSVEFVDSLYLKDGVIPVDDDWYYEMVALRAFEKYGIQMSVDDLGRQWIANSAGTWGSSKEALRLLKSGVPASEAGHPKNNKLWFTIGPQFSSDIYGALSPGLPNMAAYLANKYGHINGYAEAVDGAVFVAGMISIAFADNDPASVVKKAAQLIHPSSPYRQCIDGIIKLYQHGASFEKVVQHVEDRWHIEYPATNNAVANGGIVAASVLYGKGDFLKTVNLAFSAADFTDADCNAANAASVIGAINGLKGIPGYLLKTLGDRIKGDKMGDVQLTPSVDESLDQLSSRTAAIGKKMLIQNGARLANGYFSIPVVAPKTMPLEAFSLADLTRYWNPGWSLERAGFGGANGGLAGIRGITYVEDSILATYPRDEVRGLLLRKRIAPNNYKELHLDAGCDSGRAWLLDVFINNKRVLKKIIEGTGSGRKWYPVDINLEKYKGDTIILRLYQRVLLPGKEAGNAYWKNVQLH